LRDSQLGSFAKFAAICRAGLLFADDRITAEAVFAALAGPQGGQVFIDVSAAKRRSCAARYRLRICMAIRDNGCIPVRPRGLHWSECTA
jgi:hypothetical protein